MKTTKNVLVVGLILLMAFVTACGGDIKPIGKTADSGKAEQKPAAEAAKEPAKKVDFPTKEITWIVPLSPGGIVDSIARLSAEYLKKYLPKEVPILVKNVPGAEWAIGLGQFAKSKPDGHTIAMFAIPGNAVGQIKGDAPYDLKKVEWIGRVTMYPLVGLVKKGSKYQKIDDFKNAKNFIAGSNALTGGLGLSTIAFMEEVGVKGKIIPHAGTSEAVTSLLRGDIDYLHASISTAYDLIKNGDVTALWVFSDERLSQVPDVPTIKEVGYGQLLGSARNNTSMGLPPGTPPEIVKIWRDAFDKMIKDPEFKKKLEENLKTPLLPGNAETEKQAMLDGFKAMESTLPKISKYEK